MFQMLFGNTDHNLSDTEVIFPQFRDVESIDDKALVATDEGLLRQLFGNPVQFSVALQGASVCQMKQDEFVAAFYIEDIAAVHAVHGRFVAEADFMAAFPADLIDGAIQHTIQSFPVEWLQKIIEGEYLIRLRIMLFARRNENDFEILSLDA